MKWFHTCGTWSVFNIDYLTKINDQLTIFSTQKVGGGGVDIFGGGVDSI